MEKSEKEPRVREPGDDDEVPAPARFDVNGELLPFAISKVVEEMEGGK